MDMRSIEPLWKEFLLTRRFVVCTRGLNVLSLLLKTEPIMSGTFIIKKEKDMTKAEFIAAVAEELEVPKTVAAETVEAFIAVTTKLLKAGDKITFPGFGTFSVSERAARKGRNPQTGVEIQIAASKSGKFTAGKDLKGL
jgi:DNA-binding protein HU-beta